MIGSALELVPRFLDSVPFLECYIVGGAVAVEQYFAEAADAVQFPVAEKMWTGKKSEGKKKKDRIIQV